MGGIDDVTWQALTLMLTVLGLVASFVLWRRRGTASGVRALAWTLLAPAAYLTGTMRLVWEVADSMVSWASRLVFSPTVWLGIAIAGVSAVLFLAAAQMRRRGVGTRGRPPTSQRGAEGDAELPARPSRGAAKASVDDDMADIEAILKKHGIS